MSGSSTRSSSSAARARSPISVPSGSVSRMPSAVFSDNQAVPQPGPVADYLGRLMRELSFDLPLASRVCQEVEDHLDEAVAAMGDSLIEAQGRAIRNFGDAREIASQYAALSL